ncbi:hypothetical protein ACJ72_00934 [Emergomyces africanus]|uniref:EF-hand domain-containing protein n=1 Tax=Emergomyces africanus TaxID=1955775 RepID=A0A1B7P6P1_9EURO|nr:hypothetical protein ACJ72_00934 [Emergomyces africanus]
MRDRPGIGQKRFSRDRFQRLEEGSHYQETTTTMNSNDATVNIPLTNVPSRDQTGSRKVNSNGSSSSYTPPTDLPAEHDHDDNEKNGIFHHRKGGRRMLSSHGKRQLEGLEDGTLTRMGKFYNAILNFSVVTRYFIYVSPLALLIAIPIVVGATVAQNAEIGGVRIVWFFTWVEIVWLSLWVSKVIAHYIPFVFQFLCGIVSSGTRKYALLLRALEIPFSLIGWSVTSLATFIPLMTRNPTKRASGNTGIQHWQNVVKNILFAAFISTLILFVEKLLVQLISISYHRRQFDNRIKESKRNISLLVMLYEASRTLFPEYCAEFEEEDYVISDSIVRVVKFTRGHKRVGSASPMRLIHGVGRVGDKLTAAFGNVAQEITGKQVFNSTSAHSVVTLALEKRKSSEALARRLWMSFVLQGRESLYLDDVIEVLGAGREEEAKECFGMLDLDSNGDVSLEEMILTVTEIGRVQKSINNSMHDVDQAIHVLDNLLCAVVFIMVVLVFVAFLNTGFGTTLAAGATALLSLSFVFATTAQEVLGSTIFLFVKHAMDVGDRVDIGDRQLIVERISLLYTVFRGVRDHKTFQAPNIVLNTQWIENVTRSRAMREQITLTVDFGTSFADIQLLKAEMQKFVRDKENARDFQPDVDIEVVGLGSMDKLELKIEIRHKSNWSNETVRATRRSKFMCALVLAVRKIPIHGPGGGDAVLGDIMRPSYSVAISQEQAQASQEEWSKGKEGKRMVPTSEMDEYFDTTKHKDDVEGRSTAVEGMSPTGSPVHRGASTRSPPAKDTDMETSVVKALHTRPPAMDQARVDESEILRQSDTGAGAGETGSRTSNPSNRDGLPPHREPSTGRRTGAPVARYVSPNTPIDEAVPTQVVPTRSAPPLSAPGFPPPAQHQPPTARSTPEYFELTQRDPSGAAAGRENPHYPSSNTNNPYVPRPSPPPLAHQMPPQSAAAYGGGSSGNPPMGSGPGTLQQTQATPSRRLAPGGNAFALHSQSEQQYPEQPQPPRR